MEASALERDSDGRSYVDLTTLRVGTPTAVLHEVTDEHPYADRVPFVVSSGGRFLRALLMAADIVAVAAAWILAMLGPWAVYDSGRARWAIVGACVLSAVVLARILGLYQSRVSSARALEIAHLGKVSVTTVLPALLIESGAHRVHVVDLVVGFVGSLLGLVLLRSIVDAWFRQARRSGRHCRPEIVIGTDYEAEELCQLFIDHPDLGHRIVGAVGPRPSAPLCDGAVPWLGGFDDATGAAAAAGATGAFVVPGGIEPAKRRRVVDALRAAGLHVHLTTGLYGVASNRMKAAPVAHEAMLYLQDWRPSQMQLFSKRVADIVVAGLTLLVTSPVLLVCAVLVKLSSPGPVLFRQQRVGRGGRTFKLYKLRTMVVDAEARKAALEQGNRRNGPLFKLDSDPRVTRIGRFLRMSSLDELPQLFNVLKGEMSLIGPRPALPEEVAKFDDALLERHLVKPGITGLWQVEARENPSFGPYRRLDLFYAQNWSMSLDIVILILTVQVVATRVLLGFAQAVGIASRENASVLE